MGKLIALIGLVVLILLLVFGLGLLFAFPVMWLVNYVFTPAIIFSLFGVAQLTFWKAYALSAICGFLFKSSPATANSN